MKRYEIVYTSMQTYFLGKYVSKLILIKTKMKTYYNSYSSNKEEYLQDVISQNNTMPIGCAREILSYH